MFSLMDSEEKDKEPSIDIMEHFVRKQMPVEKRLDQFQICCDQGKTVFQERNREYRDAFELMGVIGVAVELIGLAGRLVAMVIQRPDHGAGVEGKVYNALLDIHNFANIGMQMVSEENWDGRSQK